MYTLILKKNKFYLIFFKLFDFLQLTLNYLITLWRQPVTSYLVEDHSVRVFGDSGFHSGTPGIPLRGSTRYPGAPLPLCSYSTRCLVVVDRTLCACPVTCSSRHLTSHLFHSYIYIYIYKHYSFPSPTGLCCLSLFVLGQYRLRAWGSKTTRESS